MSPEVFVKRSRIPAPVEQVFRWHEDPAALSKLAPPWDPVEIVEHAGIRDGCRAVLIVRQGLFRIRWVAEHFGYIPNRQFRDVQLEGPFKQWVHTHRFEPAGPDACVLEDRVEYLLPLGALGRWLAGSYARRRLERLFDYRHAVTQQAFGAERAG